MIKHNAKYINNIKFQNRLFKVALFFGAVGAVLYFTKPPIISPCQDSGCHVLVKTVYVEESMSELEQITAYIVKKFEPHGRQVAVKALACFISESGLRPDAIHVNSDVNKTTDAGIAQVNLFWHRETAERMTNWKLNIDKAEKIYASRKNFSAWYGKGCN